MRTTRTIPDTACSEVEWSERAMNCLNFAGITTLGQLARMDGKALQSGKNVGVITMREFLRVLVANHIVPNWVREVKLSLAPVTFEEIEALKFVECAGPFGSGERWMLELAIAQLGDVPWAVAMNADGSYMLYRDRVGCVEVEAEEL